MRLIEREMLNAVRELRAWKYDNTEVKYSAAYYEVPKVDVYLFGNRIATVTQVRHDKLELWVDEKTLADHPTNTTISRLRALGADIKVIRKVVYLNGFAITTRD